MTPTLPRARVLAGLAGLAVLVVLAAGCASMGMREPLNVSVAGVEPLPSEALEIRLAVKLRVQNPNDAPIEYDGAFVELEVEGREFASGVSGERGTVPRYGEAIVTIPVTAPAFRMAIGAIGVINGRYRGAIDYQLHGRLDGPGFDAVRFDSHGRVDLTGIAAPRRSE
jgi:LEA14-like dessication related protein